MDDYLGFIEFFVVAMFVMAWGVLELVGRRLDKKKEAERAKQHAKETSARKAMMGSGDRSQRIRTYNFPQNRCTDHRLGGESGGEKNFNLDQIMAGQLEPLINALLDLDKQQRLEEL